MIWAVAHSLRRKSKGGLVIVGGELELESMCVCWGRGDESDSGLGCWAIGDEGPFVTWVFHGEPVVDTSVPLADCGILCPS